MTDPYLHANAIAALWLREGSPDWDYFQRASSPMIVERFWGGGSQFAELFSCLDPMVLLEIACGQGRHTEQAAKHSRRVLALEASPDALAIARRRLQGFDHVEFLLTPDGRTIPGVPDSTCTAVFSYDSFPHFEIISIHYYLCEVERVLIAGGRALLQISNNATVDDGLVLSSRSWRNYMTEPLFRHLANRAGLRVLEHRVISFVYEESDALVLLEKPRG